MNIVIEEYGRVIIVAITALIVFTIATMLVSERLTLYANENIAEIDAKHSVQPTTTQNSRDRTLRFCGATIRRGDTYVINELFETDGEQEDADKIRIISITDPEGNEISLGADDEYEFLIPGKYVVCLSYHGIWAFNIPVTI